MTSIVNIKLDPYKFDMRDMTFLDKNVWSLYSPIERAICASLRRTIADLSMNPNIRTEYSLTSDAVTTDLAAQLLRANENFALFADSLQFLTVRINAIADTANVPWRDNQTTGEVLEALLTYAERYQGTRYGANQGVDFAAVVHQIHNFLMSEQGQIDVLGSMASDTNPGVFLLTVKPKIYSTFRFNINIVAPEA